MTSLIGYLVRDDIDDIRVFEGWAWAESFGQNGVFIGVGGYPSKDHSSSRRKEFIGGVMSVYTGLRKRGYEDIMMAMTLYSDAFDDYELKYLDREADPSSHEDWLALLEIFNENLYMEKEFYDKYRTPKAKIARIFRSKKERVEKKMKGVLAVARIRSDVEI